MSEARRPVCRELHQVLDQGVELSISGPSSLVAQLTVRPVFLDRIRSGQESDAQLRGIMEDVRAGRPSDFQVDSEGIL